MLSGIATLIRERVMVLRVDLADFSTFLLVKRGSLKAYSPLYLAGMILC